MRISKGSYAPVTESEIQSVFKAPDLSLINSPSEQPRVTWIGHASVLVQYKGINFLTDPHLTDRPAPIDFLIKKRLTAPAISFEEMPKIDFIVVSHNHYDHLDHRTVKKFANSVVWYVPEGLKAWFVKKGIHVKNIVELKWWQSHAFNEEVNVTLTPAVHWSKRSPWDTNQSHWGSWSVKIAGLNTWFAGDTAYDESVFKEIGQRTGPYDLSFIPIGAYEPRSFMGNQHIDPAQAVMIHQDIQSTKSIPIHWATFQLTHEPFLEPAALLKEERDKAGIAVDDFKIIKIGHTTTLSSFYMV